MVEAAALGLRLRRRAWAAPVVLALAFTGIVWTARGVDVAYGSEGMHIAVAAVVATVALVAGGLAWLRHLRSGRLSDLAVALAFALVVPGENLFAVALPTLLNHEVPVPSAYWVAAALELLSALVLLLATVAGGRRIGLRGAAALAAGLAVLVAGLAAGLVFLAPGLPLPIDPALSPVGPLWPVLIGSHTMIALEAAVALVLLGAGSVAVLRARLQGDPVFALLGPALLVGGIAAANYVLFPSLYSYWVYSGDVLRLSFCLVLAWGVAVEVRSSVRRAIDAAVLEERRRLARDLHDGVAQELAFIATEVAELDDGSEPSLAWIASAAERGLYEARRAIAALTLPLGLPLGELLEASLEDVAARSGVALDLEVERDVAVSPAVTEAVLRVAREAATNAVRHGHATKLRIVLRGERGIELSVEDNGSGIDDGAVHAGFGLTSLRERTELTGGRLRVSAATGGGAVVTAEWPT